MTHIIRHVAEGLIELVVLTLFCGTLVLIAGIYIGVIQ